MIGEWPGSNGLIRYTDTDAQAGKTYAYYVIPVHPQLKIGGKQVVGPASKKIELKIPVNPFLSERDAA